MSYLTTNAPEHLLPLSKRQTERQQRQRLIKRNRRRDQFTGRSTRNYVRTRTAREWVKDTFAWTGYRSDYKPSDFAAAILGTLARGRKR